jgi:hypothetical protein
MQCSGPLIEKFNNNNIIKIQSIPFYWDCAPINLGYEGHSTPFPLKTNTKQSM